MVRRLIAQLIVLVSLGTASSPPEVSLPKSRLVAVLGASGLLAPLTVNPPGVLPAQRPIAGPENPGPAPMRQLLVRGVGVAPVKTGLSFALTITNGGRGILAGPWALRAPRQSAPLKLSLEEATLEAGTLEAVARIKNETGVFAGGLRLDFLEVTEAPPDPRPVPSNGSAEATSRAIALDSPLFFGDLQPGADAAVRFRLGPIDLALGSPYAVVRGIVTGVIAVESVAVPESSDPMAIDSDWEGVVYVGDGAGQAVFRVVTTPRSVRKFDAGCPVTGIAVRKKSGEVFASCRGVSTLLRLSPGGRMSKTEPIGRALGPIRFGGKGFLYGAPASIVRLEGLSIAEEIGRAAERPLQVSGFDVGPDGTIWAISSETERRLLRIRSARDIVSLAGAGEGLGAIASPLTCRVGPDGNVYVLEGPDGGRPPRVSVFDRAGGLERVWDLPAAHPADLAFAGEDRLEIIWKREDSGSAVTVFRKL